MAPYLGRAVILEWGDAQILGVREKGVTYNGEAVNVSSDEDGGWRKLLEEAGENSVDIAISGVVKDDSLKIAWATGERTKTATLTYPNGAVVSGEFYLATFTDTGPYNDASTFEGTLQSTGAVTYTPYS